MMRMDRTAISHTPRRQSPCNVLRLTAIPNLNARHDPCPGTDLAKPLSPLETLRSTSYHGSMSNGFFHYFTMERRFHTALFAKNCWERIFAQHCSRCYSGTRKSHQLCSHLLFCMELRPPQARKSHSQKRRWQQEESSKSKNGAAEAPVHNLNAASSIDNGTPVPFATKFVWCQLGGKNEVQNEVKTRSESWPTATHMGFTIYPSGPKKPVHNVGAAKPNSQRCQTYWDSNPKHNLNAASPL